MSLEEVRLMDSVLNSIKKLLGIQESYTIFDADLIMYINSTFAMLNQIGIGPKEGFMIEDSYTTWDEYITQANESMVKSYIYLKVRLLFDPPSNNSLTESINRQLSELEWRLLLVGDTPTEGGDNIE